MPLDTCQVPLLCPAKGQTYTRHARASQLPGKISRGVQHCTYGMRDAATRSPWTVKKHRWNHQPAKQTFNQRNNRSGEVLPAETLRSFCKPETRGLAPPNHPKGHDFVAGGKHKTPTERHQVGSFCSQASELLAAVNLSEKEKKSRIEASSKGCFFK